jgi:hypothetical protein
VAVDGRGRQLVRRGTPAERAERRVGSLVRTGAPGSREAYRHAVGVWEDARRAVAARADRLALETQGLEPGAFNGQIDLVLVASLGAHLSWCALWLRQKAAGYRPLAGEEQAAHTAALARALQDSWLAGKPFPPVALGELTLGKNRIDWLAFAHDVEERLISDDRGTESPAAPFAPLGVDTVEVRTWDGQLVRGPAVTADREGPDDGHTFRLEAHSRGSYGVVGQEGHTDADWLGEPPLTVEVRAWNLKDALRKALGLSLADWSREGHRLGDPPPEAG